MKDFTRDSQSSWSLSSAFVHFFLLTSFCSTDALDALGGVEDLTMGSQFPSSNDLTQLTNKLNEGHLGAGMGEFAELEHL